MIGEANLGKIRRSVSGPVMREMSIRHEERVLGRPPGVGQCMGKVSA